MNSEFKIYLVLFFSMCYAQHWLFSILQLNVLQQVRFIFLCKQCFKVWWYLIHWTYHEILSVIKKKLPQQGICIPMLLLIVDKSSQIMFHCLDCILSLSVCWKIRANKWILVYIQLILYSKQNTGSKKKPQLASFKLVRHLN